MVNRLPIKYYRLYTLNKSLNDEKKLSETKENKQKLVLEYRVMGGKYQFLVISWTRIGANSMFTGRFIVWAILPTVPYFNPYRH